MYETVHKPWCHMIFLSLLQWSSISNDKKPTLQKLHNSKLWYRPLNHKQEQNRREFWQGRTCKTTTNNNVEKIGQKWSKSHRYLSAYMSVNMLNMSDNKPTIWRTECLVVHHVRYHVRYLTPKRHPENEIIKIRKIHFILLKVSFYVWTDTQRSLNFQLLGFPIQVKIGHLVQME